MAEFLPGESYGQRILAGYGPLDHKELDMTEMTQHADKKQLKNVNILASSAELHRQSSVAHFIFVSSSDSNIKSVNSIDGSIFRSIYGIKVKLWGIYYVEGESANILNVIISQ